MRPSLAGPQGRRLVFAACLAGGALLFRLSAAIFPRGTRRLPPGKASRILFLRRSGDASWIRVDAPLDPATKSGAAKAFFRRRFTLDSPSSAAALAARALGAAEVSVDGRSLGGFENGPAVFPLPALEAGAHEIVIAVRDPMGPALALAECPSLGLDSGTQWEASLDAANWRSAVPAGAAWDLPLSGAFGRSFPALLRILPILVPFFALIFLLTGRRPADARLVRFLVLGALILLGLNDIGQLPVWVGYDAILHMRYVQSVAANGRLPAPDADWQMFQAPLYYLLSAPLWSLFARVFDAERAWLLVRVVPISCGIVSAELCWRAGRAMYPDRRDLQAVATLVGGLLPMWLYMSQAASNEPLAGVLSAAVIVAALSVRDGEAAAKRGRSLVATGILLGLAVLSKVTAVLLVPPLLALLWTRPARRSWKERASDAGMILAPALAISGWYYARNELQFGRPFFLPSISPAWWQDPGYRTAGQLLSFGRALTAPVYAGAAGFWDSLYSTLWLDGFLSGTAAFELRPPWNYTLVLASAWLALVPSALILTGIAAALAEPGKSLKNGFLAVVGWPGVFLAAIFYGYLTLPIYSAAKASYMLGLAPCFGVLAARGFDVLARRKWAKAALSAALACWAAAGYFSYFVRP